MVDFVYSDFNYFNCQALLNSYFKNCKLLAEVTEIFGNDFLLSIAFVNKLANSLTFTFLPVWDQIVLERNRVNWFL